MIEPRRLLQGALRHLGVTSVSRSITVLRKPADTAVIFRSRLRQFMGQNGASAEDC